MDDRPRYMISVAADLVGVHPQTLRIYENKGLIRPRRTAGNTRLYSDADLERLRLIQQLTTELGLNLAGVEHVLRLQDELVRMRKRLDRMEREMRQAINEVPGGATVRADLALAAQLDARAVLDSGRDLHGVALRAPLAPGAATLRARLLDHGAVAATARTRLRERE